MFMGVAGQRGLEEKGSEEKRKRKALTCPSRLCSLPLATAGWVAPLYP